MLKHCVKAVERFGKVYGKVQNLCPPSTNIFNYLTSQVVLYTGIYTFIRYLTAGFTQVNHSLFNLLFNPFPTISTCPNEANKLNI